MTLTFNVATDRCDHCPSSQDGCAARQMFTKGERLVMLTMHCRAFFLVRIHPRQPLVMWCIRPRYASARFPREGVE